MEATLEQDRIALTLRGLIATLGLSLRRLNRSWFMASNVLLAAVPVAVCLVIATLGRTSNELATIQEAHKIYETFLRTLYLHFVVFFLANIFGFAVVRQEIENQTLHYLLMQPIRRWALFLGRFLAYLALVSVCCVGSLWLSYFVLTLPKFGMAEVLKDLFGAGRFVILLKESAVIVLGMVVYGAIAMLMGSFFKTAFYAVILLGWESILPYLPHVIKKLTVMHYLHSLLPERPTVHVELFKIIGDPSPVWLCLVVIGTVSAVVLGLAMLVFQLRECVYTDN